MREIKFRVWDGEKYRPLSTAIKDDIIGVQEDFKNQTFNELEPFFDDVIIEQYTGLKDKNGKEIYDGDKIKYHDKLGCVVWSEKQCNFCIVDIEKNWTLQEWGLWWNEVNEFEIIGNIHTTD